MLQSGCVRTHTAYMFVNAAWRRLMMRSLMAGAESYSSVKRSIQVFSCSGISLSHFLCLSLAKTTEQRCTEAIVEAFYSHYSE